MKKDIITTVIAATIITIAVVSIVLGILYGVDSKIWNNGYCSCGGKWRYDEPAGMSFVYKCDKCSKRISIRTIRDEVK